MARVPVKHPAGTRGWHEYLLNILQELAGGTSACYTSCRKSPMARVPVKHPAGTRGWREYLQTLYSLPPAVSSESIFPHSLPLPQVTPVTRLPSAMKRVAP